nr:MAG: hypothetical protein H4RhizoLitter213175_000001 [Mitovirus sp.]QDH86785.1 MAG: hypothetical protein H2RhizoLitter71590_000001 [Mitovirus sp.]QDH88122.1 MAG: hypothetical protein H1Rhizo26FD12705_000001 [Mitovirus sp.]QDH88798.1 MAG: hypothetical protein H1Rhizo253805_000001 [Mitovirus sp.]QDH89825.1 MAG: hypothetical protein H1BulkLitter61349_000003 [Mitovirus sp.]
MTSYHFRFPHGRSLPKVTKKLALVDPKQNCKCSYKSLKFIEFKDKLSLRFMPFTRFGVVGHYWLYLWCRYASQAQLRVCWGK